MQELEQLLAVFNTRNPLCLQHLLRNLPATLYQAEAYRPNRMTIQATVVSLQSLSSLLCVFTNGVMQHLGAYLLVCTLWAQLLHLYTFAHTSACSLEMKQAVPG